LWSAFGGGLRRACAGKGGQGKGRGWRGSSLVGKFDNVDARGLYLKRIRSCPSVGYEALGVEQERTAWHIPSKAGVGRAEIELHHNPDSPIKTQAYTSSLKYS
jgi:hypothetical protein